MIVAAGDGETQGCLLLLSPEYTIYIYMCVCVVMGTFMHKITTSFPHYLLDASRTLLHSCE